MLASYIMLPIYASFYPILRENTRILSIWDNISRIFVKEVEETPETGEKRGFLQMAGASVDDIINFFNTSKSKTGQMVDARSALGLSAVWRALNILADSIASLPIDVVRDSGASITPQPRHPVSRVLKVNPSPLFTPYTLLHTMVVHAALTGNGYAYIRRERVTRYPKEILIIEPHRVSIHVMENGRVVYKVDGQNRTFRPDEIIHFGGLSWNGLAGLNILDHLVDNFGLALANQEYLAKFFADGATIAGVIKHPGRLDDNSMLRLRRSWETQYGGSNNSGKTAILEQGMDYQAIGLSPQQAAAAETKKLTIADISRIFGVPQFLLEDLDRATFNNIEHLSLLFLKHTVRPWCKRIEAELNRKLFPEDEQGEYMVRFDLDDLHMVDMESRGQYIETMMKWGILNRDEIRQREKYNPIPDGSGQKYFVPMNMVDPTEEPEEQQTNNDGTEENDDSEQGDEDV